jgi:hypothetical protein
VACETTVNFRIVGPISHAETIAQRAGIRELPRLMQVYGPGNGANEKEPPAYNWTTATSAFAEVHRYEAHGIGRREMKHKRYLD